MMIQKKRYDVLYLIIFPLFLSLFFGFSAAYADENALVLPVRAKNGMIVTGQELATRAGLDVLKKGGNAVDAAVTAAFVMSVTLPRAGNIGGGGFMLIHSGKTKETIALDFWQKAPAKASRTMFIGKDGKADKKMSRESPLSVSVPGTVSGLAHALEKYGTISLAESLAPAIRYAEEGFILNDRLTEDIKNYIPLLRTFPATARIFFRPDGTPYEAGDRFVQKDLAGTLRMIAKEGPKAFYEGPVADRIVKQMEASGGLITKEDLKAYKPMLRKPVRGTYRGLEILTMYPPSAGGVGIVGILNILEGYDLGRSGHNSAETIHLTAEAMKRVFADIEEYLGDPDQSEVPVERLTSKEYAAKLRSGIGSRATRGREIKPGVMLQGERSETTHFSVIDSHGNAVSCTYTLNGNFGSGIVVGGAGFLLNNEMDNFNINPGSPDAAGIIQGEANTIAPNRRMLSAMSPTIVLRDGELFLVTGSPGSSRIISTIAQVIMNVVDHGMNVQEAVNAPKMHNERLPDELQTEKGISPDTVKLLRDRGHTLRIIRPMGAASSILTDRGILYGASDPRREGLAAGH